jgi:acetylornithine deacetylase/succinyl-diaminopimelate desuccinylase-like protein
VTIRGLLWILAALGGSNASSRANPMVEPFRVVSELAELGPRPAGGPNLSAARQTLVSAMRAAGLVGVEVEPSAELPGWSLVVGILPGERRPRLVLNAHYDTVAGSPGALDDASGCGVVIGAAAELARTRRSNPVQVALLDGEESLAAGSRAWLAGQSESARREILASLSVDMVGARGSEVGFLHLLAVRAEASAS